MSRISDLLVRQGEAQGGMALAKGSGRAALISSVAGFLPGVRAREQETEDRASQQRLLDSRLKTDEATQANAADQIRGRQQAEWTEAQQQIDAKKAVRFGDFLTEVATASDPEIAKAAYEAMLPELIRDGTLRAGEIPQFFPGMTFIKGAMMRTRDGIARAKELFPEAKAPESFTLSPGQTRFGPDGQQVANVPAPEPKEPRPDYEWVTRGGRPMQIAKGSSQPGDRPYQPPSMAQPDYEWVTRNGQPMQIRKGGAQPGDRPYDATSARQTANGNGTGMRDAYSTERNERVRGVVTRLIGEKQPDGTRKGGELSGWNTGVGGWLFSELPATDARKLRGDLAELKSNIGFNELQEMRNASQTGGALGQVAVQELDMLQSTLGTLDQFTDSGELGQRLGRIEGSLDRWEAAKRQAQAQRPTIVSDPYSAEALGARPGARPAPTNGGRVNPFR